MGREETHSVASPLSGLCVTYLILIAAFAVLPMLSLHVFLFGKQPLNDFLVYWTAGHFFSHGMNPYSAAMVRAFEVSMGYHGNPLPVIYPPWVLPIDALIAALPFSLAHTAWFYTSVVLDLFSAFWLWKYFGGTTKTSWIAVLCVITYLPAIIAEQFGQITPLILSGITAFLWLVRNKKMGWAGLALFVLALKPHLFWLVILAVGVWACKHKKFWLLLYPCLICAALTAYAFWKNPAVSGFFHEGVDTAGTVYCGLTGPLGAWGALHFPWLKYLPMLIALLWFIAYWRKHKEDWNWEEHFSLVILVSVASSPYYWGHDFLVALPAMLLIVRRTCNWQKRWYLVPIFWSVLQLLLLVCNGCSLVWMSAASVLWLLFWKLSHICLQHTDKRANTLNVAQEA